MRLSDCSVAFFLQKVEYIVLVAPFIVLTIFVIGLICIVFKKIWIGALLLIIGICFNIYTEAVPFNISIKSKEINFKVFTYNIYTSGDYFASIEKNPKEVCDLILKENADVVVLEEYYPDHCLALKDSLLKVYPYLEYQKFHCSNAVFSKYPLSNWSELEINCEDDFFAECKMKRAKDLDNTRHMYKYRYIASVTVNLPNDSVRFITCHMASNHFDQVRDLMGDSIPFNQQIKTFMKCIEAGMLEREVEAKYILKEAIDYFTNGTKVCVLGDMNDVSGGRVLSYLQIGNILRDGWWEKGFGLGLTFHAHKVMHFRIDHVMYTHNMKLEKIYVVPQKISDHHPLVAEFDL